MNDFTKNSLLKEAFSLIERAQALLLAARAKHEQKVAELNKKAA
jgi:hypothetical protein